MTRKELYDLNLGLAVLVVVIWCYNLYVARVPTRYALPTLLLMTYGLIIAKSILGVVGFLMALGLCIWWTHRDGGGDNKKRPSLKERLGGLTDIVKASLRREQRAM